MGFFKIWVLNFLFGFYIYLKKVLILLTLLAHLSRKLKLSFLINAFSAFVCLRLCLPINFLHFWDALQCHNMEGQHFFFEVYKVNSKITFFLNLNQPEKKLLFMWKHSLVGYFKVCSKLDSLRVDWGHNRQLCYC